MPNDLRGRLLKLVKDIDDYMVMGVDGGLIREAIRDLGPIDSSQQATLNRTRDELIVHPDAKVATVVVYAEKAETIGGSFPMILIDYGDVEPLDLTRVAGLMLRRVIKAIEADMNWPEIQKLVITRQILKAIAELPIDLGEEQKDGVEVARNAGNIPGKQES